MRGDFDARLLCDILLIRASSKCLSPKRSWSRIAVNRITHTITTCSWSKRKIDDTSWSNWCCHYDNLTTWICLRTRIEPFINSWNSWWRVFCPRSRLFKCPKWLRPSSNKRSQYQRYRLYFCSLCLLYWNDRFQRCSSLTNTTRKEKNKHASNQKYFVHTKNNTIYLIQIILSISYCQY